MNCHSPNRCRTAGDRALRKGAAGLAILCAGWMAIGLPVPGQAQDAPLQMQRSQTSEELERITGEISLSQEKLAKLDDEIGALKKDQVTITAALIQSAKTEKKLTQDIEDIGEKLMSLREQEDGIKLSLKARRGVLAEVLAALQRMGLNPPPAILVRPDDALASVRSAVLLGAVVPEMRQQTEELMGDLKEMSRVTASIAKEQARLTDTRKAQVEEQRRLSLLLEEKKKLHAQSEEQLAAERKRTEELAQKATNLKELIASLDSQMAAVREAAEAARLAEQKRLAEGQERAESRDPDANHLTAQADFASLRGRLMLPAAGRISRRYGDKDEITGSSMGEMLETAANATITSPSDGVVLYAGAFRSYGQLLILDAGGGYHIVLAGMQRIDVSQGQFVLAGEPVGAMGEKLLASAASMDMGNGAPMLYIEFRKDGKPVDPAPWWTVRLSGRTQNDT
ncbi:murein hydrolase activator EnvC family protein [Paramesorhizobium deserti]|uniref:murein hydrolase activator EnvC family protein n=1 Tax=Paramesorhizobium deserti TaxID=1494590 RepID=UPI003CC7B0A2